MTFSASSSCRGRLVRLADMGGNGIFTRGGLVSTAVQGSGGTPSMSAESVSIALPEPKAIHPLNMGAPLSGSRPAASGSQIRTMPVQASPNHQCVTWGKELTNSRLYQYSQELPAWCSAS